MKWECEKLKNGIQLIIARFPIMEKACIGIYFPKGQMDEPEDRAGVASLWAQSMAVGLNGTSGPNVWQSDVTRDYTGFVAVSDLPQLETLLSRFPNVLRSQSCTQESLEKSNFSIEQGNSENSGSQIEQVLFREYWHGSGYELPACCNQDASKLTVKQLNKWRDEMVADGPALCILAGDFSTEQLQKARMCLAGWECKAAKKKKYKLPDEFGCRKKRTEYLIDIPAETTSVEFSFDVNRSVPKWVAHFWCDWLAGRGGLESPLHRALDQMSINSRLETYPAASRLLITYECQAEDLISSLRNCFSCLSRLKESTELEPLLAQWIAWKKTVPEDPATWMMERVREFWMDGSLEVTLREPKGLLSAQKVRDGARSLFLPQNLMFGAAFPPGVLKRKKLQKVLLEGKVLLQETSLPSENRESVIRKILRYFIHDCQEQVDRILQGEDPDSAYQVWKRIQCYVHYRTQQTPHYAFAGVQEFLLGHGYSKEDVKKLKKKKDKEKKQESWTKHPKPQDDLEQIAIWFKEGTVAMLQQAAKAPEEERVSVVQKRTNLCARYFGHPERGIEAIRYLAEGNRQILDPIEDALQKELEKSEEA